MKLYLALISAFAASVAVNAQENRKLVVSKVSGDIIQCEPGRTAPYPPAEYKVDWSNVEISPEEAITTTYCGSHHKSIETGPMKLII